MSDQPRGRMLWLFPTMMLTVLLVNGCQTAASLPSPLTHQPPSLTSTPPSPSSTPAALRGPSLPIAREQIVPLSGPVQPGMELKWAIRSPVDQPGVVRAGKSVVGPDGTMMVGPYGTCKVAGLTLAQATIEVETQLSPYVKQPHVVMGNVGISSVGYEVAWKPSPYTSAGEYGQHSLAPWLPRDPIRAASGTEPLLPLPQPQLVPKDDASGIPMLAFPAGEGPVPPINQGHIVPAPVPHKRFAHHRQPPVPPVLPHGPNEMNPVLLPPYVIRPPDVLLIESKQSLLTQRVSGQHLVRPDGTVGVGIYGSVLVAGKTLEAAREDVARAVYSKMSQKPQIHPETKKPIEPPTFKDVLDGVSVDVLAYNSSVYYVITDGAGLGEQVYRFPVTGSETVLDAISHINGLPVVASPRRIWVARRNPGTNHDSIYPVDWKGISQMGATNTNWQMMPGDRLYVQADPVRRFDNNLGKILSPIERILGATLLGAQTRNALRGVVP